MIQNCPRCDYSLLGLPTLHRCPECGLEFDRDSVFFRAQWKVGWLMCLAGTSMLIPGAWFFVNRGQPNPLLSGAVIALVGLWRIYLRKSVVVVTPTEIRFIRDRSAEMRFPLNSICRAERRFLGSSVRLVGQNDREIGVLPGGLRWSIGTGDKLVEEINRRLGSPPAPPLNVS